jgi:hypothetical protein
MCIDLSINYCATKVVGSGNVVVNGVTLSFGVLHRVRGSALLSEVNNRIGFLILDELNKEIILLCNINILELDFLSRNLLPRLDTNLI